MMPAGWEDRLVKLTNENTGGAIGWCLEPHDLAFSKLAARREKDLAFVAALLRHHLVHHSRMQNLIQAVTDVDLRHRLTEALAHCQRTATSDGSEQDRKS